MKKYKSEWNNKNIVALRKHLGITQSEMADKLGTRQQTISEWELGMYKPRGMASKLLNIVAEGANFKYNAGKDEKQK